jgi:SAM-dependent methyltransferase
MVLAQWLEGHKDRIRTVLDYGCAHGAYLAGLAERMDHLEGYGVDIDRFSIEMARNRASELRLTDRVRFGVWTHDSGQYGTSFPQPPVGLFDCALLQEVLEHVPEPWSVLQALERLVHPGGKVYLTVPFGPWEFTSYRSFPYRAHIWHFDAHDLRDMIGAKQDFELQALYAGDNPLTGAPQGWWVATYTADHRPVPPIDLQRHLWLQRPRESVSVAILCGPGAEETLHWTLRSVLDIADEVVLADCDMTDEARRIAGQYGVQQVVGSKPLKEGFENARNALLDHCRSDWCLCIDTDERLVGTHHLEKYLRENAYHAYSIRQHNFTCDTAQSADFPVRLFRRRPYQGRALRFWGAIHEHPELALNEGAGPTIALRDVNIAHLGYLSEHVRRARLVRNAPLLELDQRRYPDRVLQKHFMMRDNMHAIRQALRQTGGRVDDAMRAKCRETIALYQKYFLGRAHHARLDSIEYYSEALLMLGEGFEAVVQLEVDRGEPSLGTPKRYRFASTEDFCAELTRLATEKAKRFDSPSW